MSVLAGIILGTGLLLVWRSMWVVPPRAKTRRTSRLAVMIHQSGIRRITPTGVVIASIMLAMTVFFLLFVLTAAIPIGVCFGLMALFLPVVILRWQAKKNQVARRDIWPDAIDHLRSAIRAGLPLPESLIQLSQQGPGELRPALQEFADDYRSGVPFSDALENLKRQLADPVGDRLIAALKLTREVGGADIGQTLETLSEFLRADARMRAELEARQSWTVNGARLAVVAPWIVLLLLATQPEAAQAYQSVTGLLVLLGGLIISVICYRVMLMLGALPEEQRVL